jgi:hypothetical protein
MPHKPSMNANKREFLYLVAPQAFLNRKGAKTQSFDAMKFFFAPLRLCGSFFFSGEV